MKIMAIVGSPRPKGNTDLLIDQALEEAASRGAETEKIILSQYRVNPCLGHQNCNSFQKCKQDDDIPEILDKFRDAEGIILGSRAGGCCRECRHRPDGAGTETLCEAGDRNA